MSGFERPGAKKLCRRTLPEESRVSRMVNPFPQPRRPERELKVSFVTAAVKVAVLVLIMVAIPQPPPLNGWLESLQGQILSNCAYDSHMTSCTTYAIRSSVALGFAALASVLSLIAAMLFLSASAYNHSDSLERRELAKHGVRMLWLSALLAALTLGAWYGIDHHQWLMPKPAPTSKLLL